MGGTVGIEASKLETLDYESVKASGLTFGTAHNALQRSLKKAKSTNLTDDQTTIHFLAIRQLSHNLKNQKVLERTRHKVLKTKSLPYNTKYLKQYSFLGPDGDGLESPYELDNDDEAGLEIEPDLDHDDLALVHDEYYHHHQQSPHADGAPLDDGPPWKFKEHNEKPDQTDPTDPHTTSTDSSSNDKEYSKNIHVQQQEPGESKEGLEREGSPPAATVAAPVTAKPRKPRPVLSLQLTTDSSTNVLSTEPTLNNNNNIAGAHVMLKHTHSKPRDDGPTPMLPKGMPLSPSANVRVSPRGTLYMGKWKVMETGIFPDESLHGVRRTGSRLHPSSIAEVALDRSLSQLGHSHGGHHRPTRGLSTVSNSSVGVGLQRSNTNTSNLGTSFRRPHSLPALGGKRDFLEINTLGSGASGVVSEAIHLPSLTIVALKMLPVYNQEKRQHVSRELGVLYKNLAELRLVDDSLYQEGGAENSRSAASSTKETGSAGLGGVSSPHILSLYNAFVDPRSGMINLVIEYMDGGSLEDLVQQGGCRDEKVLADIAYQAVKGLCFLHSHKSVHRDIKPANILCSTSGLIKIGDFGISKALDKTTGFANSFVGTVSYMSPERITGESYSFSCDIWSLGLTLLAVAKGRFPLSTKEGSDSGGESDSLSASPSSPPKVVGGAAGYWAMIKAICDDEPPRAGSSFSTDFNDFIDSCLKKDPNARLSSKDLLATPFIQKNVSCLKLSGSDMNMRHRLDGHSDVHVPADKDHSSSNSNASKAKQSGAEDKMPERRAREASPSEAVHSTQTTPTAVPPSPLTTRLTNAAITRRTSQDMAFEASPTNAMRKAMIEADPAVTNGNGGNGSNHQHGMSAFSSASVQAGCIPEETEESLIDGSQAANEVIVAIRLEHLDRVLDRIAHRLEANRRHSQRMRAGGVDEDEDDEYDDTRDADLADVEQYTDEFREVQDDALIKAHDSVDSMDRLLQYKDAEPSPPALQLPAKKFASRKQDNLVPDLAADAKPVGPAAGAESHKGEKPDSKMLSHEGREAKHHPPAGAATAVRESGTAAPEGLAIAVEEKQHASHHSILKGTSAYISAHPQGLHTGVHLTAEEDAADSPFKAEEKKAIFAASRDRSSAGSAFNSSRSVHFSEGVLASQQEDHHHALLKRGTTATALHSHLQHIGIVPLEEAEEETGSSEVAAAALSHPTLPKTSSYFTHSTAEAKGRGGQDRGDSKHHARDGDADSDENDTLAVVDQAIAMSEAVSQQAALTEPPVIPVDYRRMLPKLNSRGLPKWENLAGQLHLPLHLVKMAVRSRLGALMDLEAEEEEEGEEMEVGLQVQGTAAGLMALVGKLPLPEGEREVEEGSNSGSEKDRAAAAPGSVRGRDGPLSARREDKDQ